MTLSEKKVRLENRKKEIAARRRKWALYSLEIRGYGRDPKEAINKMEEEISNILSSVNKIFPKLKTWHMWVGMISICMILSSLGFHHETHGEGVGMFILLSFIGGIYIIYHNSKEDKKLEKIQKIYDYMEDTKKAFDIK